MKKSDWKLVREAEENGMVVSMTSIMELKRTSKNNELSSYFRNNLSGYRGDFDEDTGEDVLYSINEHIKQNNLDLHLFDFPHSSGTDVRLLPITDNLQLKVLIVDEYYGDGEYSKYVSINSFVINKHTEKEDVDVLIQFVEDVLR